MTTTVFRIEHELEFAHGLKDVHVHDLGEVGDESQLVRELGQLLALHLPLMVKEGIRH
jgi:hypothetical protein